MKKYLNSDNLFLLVLIMILLGGFLKPIIKPKNINHYENRDAYKLPIFNIKEFMNGTLQDNIELAYTDQIPLSSNMKKNYNFVNNSFKLFINNFYYKFYDDVYIPISEKLYLFGGDNNLVYKQSNYKDNIKKLNNRIKIINRLIDKYDNIDFYIYFINRDTDIDFTTNTNNGMYEYLKSNINLKESNISSLEISDFSEYKDYFYKTDHHWNYKGSYKGYSDIMNMIDSSISLLKPVDTVCISSKYGGSKVLESGTKNIFYEDFCAYKFNLIEHTTYVDGKEINYGNQEDYFSNPETTTLNYNRLYGSFYGFNDKIIKFDFHDSTKENLLILGESFDNAINLLLASHFNITYNVDLRTYRQQKEKFDFSSFVLENEIDKVLLIGRDEFFELEFYF